MGREWFLPWGWTYRPASWQGGLVVAAGLAASVIVGMTAVDTSAGVLPVAVSCFLLIDWVAARTAGTPRPRGRRHPGRERILH